MRPARPANAVRLLPTLTALALLPPVLTPALAQTRTVQTRTVQTRTVQATPAQPTPAQPAPGQAVPATPPKAAVPSTSPTMSPVMSRDAVLKRGRQLVTWFYAQNLEPVWAAFLPDARANFGDDLKMFQAYRASGVTTYGKETRLLSEDVQEQGGVTYYLRTATFERGPKVQWTVAFGLDAAGRVISFGILGGSEPAPDKQALLGTLS